MKIAHLADCHLGGWRQPELQDLNLASFRKAISICLEEKVDFVLMAGDLFDSAYPSIEVLKETFSEFKRLRESGIQCLIIAGSHDYSASGKTFLDVLEKAGFCINVCNFEERQDSIILNPYISKGVAFYGYPGKKSGLEIPELKKLKFQDSPGMFKVFMLHTVLTEAKGSLPIDSISLQELPKADYYALGHLHIDFQLNKAIYGGPIFPNNFQELEELGQGVMFLVNISDKFGGLMEIKKILLKIKEALPIYVEIKNAILATEKILSELSKHNLKDKIILLRIEGSLEKGKSSDIRFNEIEDYCKNHGCYVLLKNTSGIEASDSKIEIQVDKMDKLEENIVEQYAIQEKQKENSNSCFLDMIKPLMLALSLEKNEDEKNQVFQDRLFAEINKIVKVL
jgi:DNA repair exonuclease SbcCD nuclease subunit